MNKLHLAASLLFLSALSAIAFARDSFDHPAAPAVSAKSGAVGDTHQELTKLINDLLTAAKASEWPRVAALQKSLILPDHQAWFAKVFGNANGAQAAAEYAKWATFLSSAASARGFEAPLKDGRTEVHVTRVAATGDPNHYLDRLASSRQTKTPIYQVRLLRGGKLEDFFDLGFFAYVGGRFRSLGKLRAIGN